MTRVGGAHPARAFSAIERERVRLEFVAPERALEALAQFLRLPDQHPCAILEAEQSRQPGPLPLRLEHVALHLAERDRGIRQRAILVADRVARILPSLLDQPRCAATGVFD